MRKTKCNKCAGSGGRQTQRGFCPCVICEGTGEISVYTIQELREGKVCLKHNGTLMELLEVLKFSPFKYEGDAKFYYKNEQDTNVYGYMYAPDNLPIQSVKIFLEEIEQEEWHKTHINQTMKKEPEFKWGEEVEAYLSGKWKDAIYCIIDPRIDCDLHIVIVTNGDFDGMGYRGSTEVRKKPQKITITLSQIAEKFNCKPEQIKIVE